MIHETTRLSFREAVKSDIGFLAEIQTNSEVKKYTGGVLANYENTITHIKSNPESIEGFYIIDLKEMNEAIGIVTFVPNKYLHEEEILISLMPEYWGNGYGSEALSIFKESWLNLKSKECMLATVMKENKSSKLMLKKEGFVFVKEYQDFFGDLQLVYKYERKHT